MQPFVTAGAAFLLAVLWFDLMFDVQVRRHHGEELPEDVLGSVTGYYRRVTTDAAPMNRLIAVAMLATLAGIGAQAWRDECPRGVSALSLVLAAAPIGLAAGHTVDAAVRLGSRRDDTVQQSRLARSILREHLVCAALVTTLLVVQLVLA